MTNVRVGEGAFRRKDMTQSWLKDGFSSAADVANSCSFFFPSLFRHRGYILRVQMLEIISPDLDEETLSIIDLLYMRAKCVSCINIVLEFGQDDAFWILRRPTQTLLWEG
jgi:hypothetical protein